MQFKIHTDHKNNAHEKNVMQRDFLHHAQVITTISSQISHFGFEYFLNRPVFQILLCSKYPFLYQAYLNKLVNLGDEK